MQPNKSDTSVYAFIAGLSMGAVFAAYFLPKSGKELRDIIHNKTDEVKGNLESKASEIKAVASETLDESKAVVDRTKSRLKKSDDTIV